MTRVSPQLLGNRRSVRLRNSCCQLRRIFLPHRQRNPSPQDKPQHSCLLKRHLRLDLQHPQCHTLQTMAPGVYRSTRNDRSKYSPISSVRHLWPHRRWEAKPQAFRLVTGIRLRRLWQAGQEQICPINAPRDLPVAGRRANPQFPRRGGGR